MYRHWKRGLKPYTLKTTQTENKPAPSDNATARLIRVLGRCTPKNIKNRCNALKIAYKAIDIF